MEVEQHGPQSISEGTNSLIIYRLGQVEKNVGNLLAKFDLIAQHYVTTATLMLTLEPIKERVTDLENQERAREKARNAERAQLKLALIMAIISPLASLLITVLARETGK